MMRAKFIRGKESKEAMSVGSHRLRDSHLSMDVIMDFGSKFQAHHDLPLGTTHLVEDHGQSFDFIYASNNKPGDIGKKFYNFIWFREWIIADMKQSGLFKLFKDKLIDILEAANTNYEWEPGAAKLKINIKEIYNES